MIINFTLKCGKLSGQVLNGVKLVPGVFFMEGNLLSDTVANISFEILCPRQKELVGLKMTILYSAEVSNKIFGACRYLSKEIETAEIFRS